MKYYKAVRNIQGHLVSPIAVGHDCVIYTPDEWAVAKIGKLFVFDNLEAAENFIWGEEIWNCEVGDVSKIKSISDNHQPLSITWRV